MLLAVCISNYGCTWEDWRALKKLELLSAAPRATLTLLECSPNFPRASITRYTHAKHEPILNCSADFDNICVCVFALFHRASHCRNRNLPSGCKGKVAACISPIKV